MHALGRFKWPAWHALRRQLGQALLDLLYPPRCVHCNQPGQVWCAACHTQTQVIREPVCPHCGRPQFNTLCPQCRHSPIEIDGIRSAVVFEGSVRQAIHHLKYNGKTSLAEPLGRFIVARWKTAPLPASLIVPVPLHAARLRERGYNQSTLLAEQLARACGLPVIEDALKRTKATLPQVTLDAEQRKANVHQAFQARADRVRGHAILLMDDVCTTGATLAACSQALKQAGATSVWALTLGRAP